MFDGKTLKTSFTRGFFQEDIKKQSLKNIPHPQFYPVQLHKNITRMKQQNV